MFCVVTEVVSEKCSETDSALVYTVQSIGWGRTGPEVAVQSCSLAAMSVALLRCSQIVALGLHKAGGSMSGL